jgi:outer membrane protein assembly factor BamB
MLSARALISQSRGASERRTWIRRSWRLVAALVVVVTAMSAAAAQAGTTVRASAVPSAAGGNLSAAWPSYNGNLDNTRDTTATAIDTRNVGSLKVKWKFKIPGTPTFGGLMESNAIVVGKITYLMDTNSNVYALNSSTGKLLWKHEFNSPDVGPNGVTYGWGMIFGATYTDAFALNARTGALVWSRAIVADGVGAIDTAPQIDGRNVIISTVPATFEGYIPGAMGIVYALNAFTGGTSWTFNTVKNGYLWGDPALNSGGGLWYPVAVDSSGRVFLGVGNPAPYPGTTEYPNGASRPGPNLYNDSLVALNGVTGKLLWYHQVTPHDLRDYDLDAPPIVTTARIRGVVTEVVIDGGKAGKVLAFRADDGKLLWTDLVGEHENDIGPLPATMVPVLPGSSGGILTPMAVADGVLYVPWIDLATDEDSTGEAYGVPDYAVGRGGLLAIDIATGRVLWKHPLPQIDVGGATVANSVVFTGTYGGTVYGLDAQTGVTLWTATAPAGINGTPAIDGDTLLVSAAAPGFSKNPSLGIVAYSLNP